MDTLEIPDWMKPFVDNQLKEKLSKKKSHLEPGVKVNKSSHVASKRILVFDNFHDIAEFCEKLLNKAETDTLLLGFDLDWPSAYKSVFKTKQIHICYGEYDCAILNVSEVDSIPRVFTLLLNNPNVRLFGFNIHKDLIKLGKEFSFKVEDIIANLEDPAKYLDRRLSCSHRWSFKSVAEEGFGTSEDTPKEQQIEKFNFKGIINFTSNINDCGAVCEKLLNIANYLPGDENLVFGFDVEWPFTYKSGPGNGKVALIQMCPEERICFLFQVSSFKALPKSLVLLLNHPRVRLSGLNIANDIRKIGRDFKIEVADILKHHLIELSSLANRKLNLHHRWSLDGLVLNQLNKILEKPKDIRISNWAADPLKREQITYAASDAYASLAVYNHLMKVKSPNLLALVN